jgi:hypothetical protein
MSQEPTDMLILAKSEPELLGGSDRVWKRINVETLKENVDRLVSSLSYSLSPTASTSSGFRVSEISVAVTINASGEIGILGTGVEVGAEASLTLTLTPK